MRLIIENKKWLEDQNDSCYKRVANANELIDSVPITNPSM